MYSVHLQTDEQINILVKPVCLGANSSPGDATRGDHRLGGAGAVRQNVQAEAHQARYV
jgi:hypothetical protein